MLYVYMDESEFAEPNNYVGMGSLVSKEPISKDLIESALKNLRDDPDSHDNNMDKGTLERGFFHACTDSKNAHSHIMNEINSKNLHFFCDFYSKTGERSEMQVHLDKISSSFVISILNVSSFGTEKINFFIERRATETESFYKNLKQILYDRLFEDIYESPYLKTYFPDISVNIVNKNEPGVQFVDFLLWTINRKHNNDNTWYNRIKARIKTSARSESGSWGAENFDINRGVDRSNVESDYLSIFPENPDELVTNNDLIDFFVNAREVVEFFYKNKSYSDDYLFEGFVDKLTSLNIHQFFESTVKSFLMIFDNKGLVESETNPDHKIKWLLARKYLSLTKRIGYVHGVTTRMFLMKYLFDNVEVFNK